MRKFNSRILIILFVLVILFLVLRQLMVPPTFGEYGWYRAESVKEVANQLQKFASAYQCFDCHINEYVLWEVGKHKKVRCESCHGALKSHTQNPEKYNGYDEFLSPKAYSSIQAFCLSCHNESVSKPESFPQVAIEHVKYWNCSECHNPHHPEAIQ